MLKLVWNARDFCMSYLAGPGLRCFGRLWCLYSEYLISSQSLYAWVANLIVFVAVYSVVENFDQLRYDNKYYGFLTFIARNFNSHCMQWFIIQASCLRGKAHFLLLKLYIAIPCLYIAMLCLFMGPFIARCFAPFLVFPPCFSNKSSCSFLCAFASCSSPCSAY